MCLRQRLKNDNIFSVRSSGCFQTTYSDYQFFLSANLSVLGPTHCMRPTLMPYSIDLNHLMGDSPCLAGAHIANMMTTTVITHSQSAGCVDGNRFGEHRTSISILECLYSTWCLAHLIMVRLICMINKVSNQTKMRL